MLDILHSGELYFPLAGEITELQTPGGKKLDGKTFLRGRNIAGSVLS